MSTINNGDSKNKLINEILIEASKQYPKSGYGQIELLELTFKILSEKIDNLNLLDVDEIMEMLEV